ncbi:hypothetical protein PHMEG_0004772 [Phytophthora megakarya]|uniref:Uncharacterized protein n=1 Tax=Phytophthora megakarya TaxID=4795 RepID=A0A225WT15_9STRA|nr:hypothetical protein PHMEG_0004772 [Phytophthora megakarya]
METLTESCGTAVLPMDAPEPAGCRPMDTPDRTSSEDEPNPVALGLPPIAPVKPAKAAKDQPPSKRPSVKTPVAAKKAVKMGKAKTPKKAAANVDRRRKRKKKRGISQTSAMKLFQCSCQLLRTQTLDYDVRAREMEDRNAAQTKEIDDWEKRIRSLKRELEEYADEQAHNETALALVEGPGRPQEQPNPLSAAATAVADAALPPTVLAAEAKLQDELRKRTNQVNEFCRSIPGFIASLDEQTAQHF